MNICITALTKFYNKKKILDITDCTIRKGIITGIIGPNGAGKSTLVKILAGLENASAGSISYEGEQSASTMRDRITMVFQKPYMLRSTVYKNIAYPLKLRKYNQAEIDVMVKAIIKEMELHDFANQKAWKLSGGEAQKVALARALAFKPSVLILDEPTANIDPLSISMMEKMIVKARDEMNMTIIMVTHNLQQARRICDEIIFMHQGKIVEQRVAVKLINSPESSITKNFIKGELLSDINF